MEKTIFEDLIDGKSLTISSEANETEFSFAVEDIKTLTEESNGIEEEKTEPKIEFSKDVSELDKWDTLVACASGTLTAVLSTIFDKKLDLLDAHNWGEKECEKLIKKVAKAEGCKSGNVYGRHGHIEHLENHTMPSDKLTPDFGGGRLHHFHDFSHHCSSVGLVSSVLTQFTGLCFGTNAQGVFMAKKLPEGTELGTDVFDKLYRGIFEWMLHLLSDVNGSSQATNGGAGITGPLLSHMKLASSLPPFSSNDDESKFAKALKNLYTGKDSKVKFDLRTEIGTARHIIKNSWTVLINEILVRVFYSIKRLILEIQEKKDYAVGELNWERILPFNNRTVRRMLTISSGVFVAITTAGAAIKGAKQSGGNGYAFLASFVLNLNFAGIGRFAIALAFDAKYIKEDIKDYCKAFKERYGIREPKALVGIDKLCLNKGQSKILYSLKRQKVLYDIEKSSKSQRSKKQEWLDNWEQKINSTTEPLAAGYFIKKEDELYRQIETEIEFAKNTEWLYLVGLELLFFVPYYPLGNETNKGYKNLKLKAEYEKDIFCKKQNIISNEAMNQAIDDYKKYVDKIDERIRKKLLTVTIVSNILLPGDITGLSMLLATPLAAGGYVATEQIQLIMGGGELFGITGANVPNFSEKGIILNECVKLLIYCKNAIPNQHESLDEIKETIEETIKKLNSELEKLEKSRIKDRENKEKIKSCKISLEYLNKCILEISNIKKLI